MVLSEPVGTTHVSSTSPTTRPYDNARLYEHRQHIYNLLVHRYKMATYWQFKTQ